MKWVQAMAMRSKLSVWWVVLVAVLAVLMALGSVYWYQHRRQQSREQAIEAIEKAKVKDQKEPAIVHSLREPVHVADGEWTRMKKYITDDYGLERDKFNVVRPTASLKCDAISIRILPQVGYCMGVHEIQVDFDE